MTPMKLHQPNRRTELDYQIRRHIFTETVNKDEAAMRFVKRLGLAFGIYMLGHIAVYLYRVW